MLNKVNKKQSRLEERADSFQGENQETKNKEISSKDCSSGALREKKAYRFYTSSKEER